MITSGEEEGRGEPDPDSRTDAPLSRGRDHSRRPDRLTTATFSRRCCINSTRIPAEREPKPEYGEWGVMHGVMSVHRPANRPEA